MFFSRENANSADLDNALSLNYRDGIWQGFSIMAYNNDSSAVVFDVTSLLGKPTNLISVMPTKNGNYSIKATPKPELSFIRGIRALIRMLSLIMTSLMVCLLL